MSIQEEDVFKKRIKAVENQTSELYQTVREIPWKQPQIVITCLEELQVALEELRIAEEELRQQNEKLQVTQQLADIERQRYQELFEFAPDGYLVTDCSGNIQEANRVAAALLNIQQRHLLRKPIVSFVAEEQRRSFRQSLNQLPIIHRVQDWEVQLCGRESKPFTAALTVETVWNHHQQAIALRWLVRDISARKHTEECLRQVQLQNLELQEADRLKNQFLAMISHELRTPMNAILGFSEVLLRRFHHQQDLQYAGMIERIFRNGKHLLTLIEDLLDVSKIQAEQLELRLEPFNLAELISSTVDDLRSLAEQKALILNLQLPEPEISVVNDRLRMQQVLINLLSNAIKFTEIGSIQIELLELPEGRLAITVSDTGIGIAPADQEQIFQKFWQVNQSTTRKHGGTGLGLAISKALVELMQGSISVESQLGQGTTFRIEIPRWVQP
ncbi:ATP-binding protein [Pantanalinema rosaneae CENA516]|uniref:PAS domain-containing sensor histidine kinase n=1 Tax=Pantanalinema rosaneae TaxID=1620701 RepID=UPI003D6ECD57